MATSIELVAQKEKQARADLKLAQEALASKKFDVYENARNQVSKSVDAWCEALKDLAYEEFRATEKPLVTAIKTLYVSKPRVREVFDHETQKTTGIEIDDDKTSRIDIEDFCKKSGIATDWLKACTELLTLLQCRKTDIYTLPASKLAAGSYYFIQTVRKAKAGETPYSNTKICEKMQSIVDAVIFEDNGQGKNKHRCTHRDITFVEDCAHKFDPKANAGIVSLKPRAFQTVMVSVLYAMITGEAYTVKNIGIPKK